MNLNEKIKSLRKNKGLTQEGLAEELNVSRQAITKWENGIGIPDIENVKAISTLFEISIDELLKDDMTIEKNTKICETIFTKEIDIDHSKKFDIKIDKSGIETLTILKSNEEKVRIDIESEEITKELADIKIDDLYNRMDINIKLKNCKDAKIIICLPEKYINDIELDANIKTLNLKDINIINLEYDGKLKYLNVEKSKGKIVLNTTCSDVEVKYDEFDGGLEVNIINSTARVKLPVDSKYKTVLKGKKNKFVNENVTENSENYIELNGMNSKLIFE